MAKEEIMDIKSLRAVTGLNKTDFGKLYGIPFRTIQNWERDINKMPGYVLALLNRVVREDFPEAYENAEKTE